MKGTTPGTDFEGGHIIRPPNRKDRHSKVYTAKGPRERRVRLAAHTAIQFYDVQDRLGYDRPTKAVDWLIHKAQTAIHNLGGPLPPPMISNPSSGNLNFGDHQSDSLFPGGDSDPRASFHGEDLGLSLQSFQEGFHGWNNCSGMDTQAGFGIQEMPFYHRELLQSSNLAVNHRTDDNNGKYSDFETPFELGFRIPTRIYGEEEASPMNNRRMR